MQTLQLGDNIINNKIQKALSLYQVMIVYTDVNLFPCTPNNILIF